MKSISSMYRYEYETDLDPLLVYSYKSQRISSSNIVLETDFVLLVSHINY